MATADLVYAKIFTVLLFGIFVEYKICKEIWNKFKKEPYDLYMKQHMNYCLKAKPLYVIHRLIEKYDHRSVSSILWFSSIHTIAPFEKMNTIYNAVDQELSKLLS